MPTHNLQITFLFFSYLNLSPNLLPPPPQFYTFRRLNSIDHTSFHDDLKQSSLITNPPQLLNPLLDEYDTTLHSLLDKHAPVTTKRSTRHSPQWFTESIRTARRACRQAESTYRSHIPLQTILSSGVFAINITNLSLQPRQLTTHSWSNPHQIALDASGTQ